MPGDGQGTAASRCSREAASAEGVPSSGSSSRGDCGSNGFKECQPHRDSRQTPDASSPHDTQQCQLSSVDPGYLTCVLPGVSSLLTHRGVSASSYPLVSEMEVPSHLAGSALFQKQE